MAKDYEAALQSWADKIDPVLPAKCPKCNRTLDQIKYAYDISQTTIHLTHAVSQLPRPEGRGLQAGAYCLQVSLPGK